MERAILKTLVYADIFNYPLTLREIHKWLIGPPGGEASKKVSLQQIEKKLPQKNYYCLPGREKIIKIRKQRIKQSKIYLRKAKIIAWILKLIPWIKLVGISGGLAMENAGKKDDIDLFVITAKNRLWITRFLVLGLLSLIGQRRKRNDLPSKVAGKLCINTLLEEDCLEQSSKNIYLAHEVLQMKVLWQRDGIYSKYLEDNSWAFRYLPNWTSQVQNSEFRIQNYKTNLKIFDEIENIAKKIQLKIMQRPKGMERIENGALYFHPRDYGKEILAKFKLKIAPLDK